MSRITFWIVGFELVVGLAFAVAALWQWDTQLAILATLWLILATLETGA